MITYFRQVLSLCLLINTLCTSVYAADIQKKYAIIDYTSFIAIANNEEKEIVAQLSAQEGNELFAAYFIVKAHKGLTPLLERLRHDEYVIATISAGQKFYDMVADKVFAMNNITLADLDNLGTRTVVQKSGIVDADLVAAINANYIRVTLITASNTYDIGDIDHVLRQQLHNLEVESYFSAFLLPQ